jgi:hypothetical protein
MIDDRVLVARVGGVIAATVALAIALALLLAFLKFDQRFVDVTVARLGLVVEEVRRQSETGLALGLELAELEDLTGVLQRAAGRGMSCISTFWMTRARCSFPSAPARLGSGRIWGGLVADADGRLSRRARDHELLLTGRLGNGFGQMVGDVAVYADLTPQHQALAGVRRELLSSTAPLVVVALLMTLVAVFLTVRLSGGADGGPDHKHQYPGAPLKPGEGRLRLRLAREKMGNQS